MKPHRNIINTLGRRLAETKQIPYVKAILENEIQTLEKQHKFQKITKLYQNFIQKDFSFQNQEDISNLRLQLSRMRHQYYGPLEKYSAAFDDKMAALEKHRFIAINKRQGFIEIHHTDDGHQKTSLNTVTIDGKSYYEIGFTYDQTQTDKPDFVQKVLAEHFRKLSIFDHLGTKIADYEKAKKQNIQSLLRVEEDHTAIIENHSNEGMLFKATIPNDMITVKPNQTTPTHIAIQQAGKVIFTHPGNSSLTASRDKKNTYKIELNDDSFAKTKHPISIYDIDEKEDKLILEYHGKQNIEFRTDNKNDINTLYATINNNEKPIAQLRQNKGTGGNIEWVECQSAQGTILYQYDKYYREYRTFDPKKSEKETFQSSINQAIKNGEYVNYYQHMVNEKQDTLYIAEHQFRIEREEMLTSYYPTLLTDRDPIRILSNDETASAIHISTKKTENKTGWIF